MSNVHPVPPDFAATARLRKVVSEYSEQVEAEFKQRDADEARAVDQKVADLQADLDVAQAVDDAQDLVDVVLGEALELGHRRGLSG